MGKKRRKKKSGQLCHLPQPSSCPAEGEGFSSWASQLTSPVGRPTSVRPWFKNTRSCTQDVTQLFFPEQLKLPIDLFFFIFCSEVVRGNVLGKRWVIWLSLNQFLFQLLVQYNKSSLPIACYKGEESSYPVIFRMGSPSPRYTLQKVFYLVFYLADRYILQV